MLSQFSERVAGTYATEDVLPRMAEILGRGLGAASAEVWLHVGSTLRRSASWPEARPPEELTIRGDQEPVIPGADRVRLVRHGEELLGAVVVAMPPGETPGPVQEQLLQDLASQAGLLLRNVRLIEELRASRQRLVAAQDEERRRLERNIHDGAQQQLVALALKLNIAESLVGRDEEQERSLLSQLKSEVQDALENLRDLARGIYPPLLADQGLVAALQAQARKATFPVSIEADHISRYPQEAEAAVYFCTLEALQNVAKYAGATKARVKLRTTDGALSFEVSDDGAGFDPTKTSYGTGLQGMADRLAALGGEVEVLSEPGEGTTVIGRLPVPQRQSGEEVGTTMRMSAAPT